MGCIAAAHHSVILPDPYPWGLRRELHPYLVPYEIASVDIAIVPEIEAYGLLRYVLDDEVPHDILIEPELAEVRAEYQGAARSEMHRRGLYETVMIPLDVEHRPVLAVGEGRWIAEYEVEPVIGIPEPVDRIASVEEVLDVRGVAVEPEVRYGPVKVCCRGIHGDCGYRAALDRVERRRCRIAEEVQKALPVRHLLYELPYRPVIEEYACIEIVLEVDQGLDPVLPYDVEPVGGGDPGPDPGDGQET